MNDWSEINDDAAGVKFCDQWICDFEAVGYVIIGGRRHCLCATCREAFFLGLYAAASGGDAEFYGLDDGDGDGDGDGEYGVDE